MVSLMANLGSLFMIQLIYIYILGLIEELDLMSVPLCELDKQQDKVVISPSRP